jgi:hypothetical protein
MLLRRFSETLIVYSAILAAALQVLAPALEAAHAVEHAIHDARLAADLGDVSRHVLRANAPVHEHENGESSSTTCAARWDSGPPARSWRR